MSGEEESRLRGVGTLFSDVFKVEPSIIEEYGAINPSLFEDVPLFIDPFLLFHSDRVEYRELHEEIIKYLLFLRQEVVHGNIDEGLLKAWFCFKEVNQTWLGFAGAGNRGSGLGRDFATKLKENFERLFSPESQKITKSHHLEKLCLISKGVGRDRISDFTTNLIKGYLCEYTQTFATRYLDAKSTKTVSVSRGWFNYETRSWVTCKFTLPWFNGDYVLLVPSDILRRDNTWINAAELLADFDSLPMAIPDDQLRANIDDYFRRLLPSEKVRTKADLLDAQRRTIERFPELIDYYILIKEERGDEAEEIASKEVNEVRYVREQLPKALASGLDRVGFYDVPGDSLENLRSRALFFKQVVENQDLYRVFWRNGKVVVSREEDFNRLFRLTWFGSEFDYNAEVNNGRGPVDGKASKGRADKSLVEFKLASSPSLRRNLEKQMRVYEAANDTTKSIWVIVGFRERDLARAELILQEMGLESDPNYILIDACGENKKSGSKA